MLSRDVLSTTGAALIQAFAVLAAVSVPLAAFGAANDWWFLNNRGAPLPTTAPQVVKEGEWDGQPWQLIAYPPASQVSASRSCRRTLAPPARAGR